MENRFKTSFEEELAEGLAYLQKTLSTLIQYTIMMGANLKTDKPASEYFQELEQQLHQIREKVNNLSLNLNTNLRKSTPFITKLLAKEIRELSYLHHKAASDPKNEYTTAIRDLQSDLQIIIEELKRFNHP